MALESPQGDWWLWARGRTVIWKRHGADILISDMKLGYYIDETNKVSNIKPITSDSRVLQQASFPIDNLSPSTFQGYRLDTHQWVDLPVINGVHFVDSGQVKTFDGDAIWALDSNAKTKVEIPVPERGDLVYGFWDDRISRRLYVLTKRFAVCYTYEGQFVWMKRMPEHIGRARLDVDGVFRCYAYRKDNMGTSVTIVYEPQNDHLVTFMELPTPPHALSSFPRTEVLTNSKCDVLYTYLFGRMYLARAKIVSVKAVP